VLERYGPSFYSADFLYNGKNWFLIEINDRPGVPSLAQDNPAGSVAQFFEIFADFIQSTIKKNQRGHDRISIFEKVDIVDADINGVPAKIDTGAYGSSIWATDIRIEPNQQLSFVLFGEPSPFYTGERICLSNFKVARVKSSMGEVQTRYKVRLTVRLAGRKLTTWFNLSDRSHNLQPILIGRKTVNDRFMVYTGVKRRQRVEMKNQKGEKI
jgi:hypothetical protein